MKKKILVFCLIIISSAFISSKVYAVGYVLDEFIQKNGTAVFHDTFSDGNEPPAGPVTGSDYYVFGAFVHNRENNNMLELNILDGELNGKVTGLEMFVVSDDHSFRSGSGGSVSAAILVDGEYVRDTRFGVQIVNTVPETDEAFAFIKVKGDSSIHAYWGDENRSYTEDITSALGTDKKITVKLSIDTSNHVTAMWDYGSDGTFELTKTNYSQLEFLADRDYSGAFGVFYDYYPYDENMDSAIGDFELLHAIDVWAGGNLGDFELLDLIDYWAAGCYQWDAVDTRYMDGCGVRYKVAEYFPLGQDDTWTYPNAETHLISGTEIVNGVDATKMIIDVAGGDEYLLLDISSGILIWHKIADIDNIAGCGWSQTVFTPPITFGPAEMSIGEKNTFSTTANYSNCTGTGASATQTVTIENTLEAVEDVTVPAGTFENSLKFKFKLTSMFNDQGETQNSDQTWWMAKGVGIVKSIENGRTEELISATVGGVNYP